MRRKFLGDIPSAPAVNRNTIAQSTDPLRPTEFYGDPSKSDKDTIADDRFRKRQYAKIIGEWSIDRSAINVDRIRTWGDMNTAVGAQLDATFGPQGRRKKSGDQKRIVKAALEGIKTITATQELTPRVVAHSERHEYPLHEHSRRTVGIIATWMGVHHFVDAELAFALSEYKPSSIETVFEDLHFDPELFVLHSSGAVILGHDKYDGLRGSTQLHPMYEQGKKGALYGCPAGRVIPKIYLDMNDLAAEAGLHEATYDLEKEMLAA